MDRFYVDLKKQNFTHIAYRLKGYDEHLRKNHSHEGFEIIQTWSREGYVLIKDKVYPMKEGALYLINGIESHSTNPTHEKDYERSKITFSPSYLRTLLEFMGQPHLLDPFIVKPSSAPCMLLPPEEIRDEIDGLFRRMEREFLASASDFSSLVTACMLEMLILVYRLFTLSQKELISHALPQQRHVSRVIEYVNQNLTREFDLDVMCEEIHLSKYYVCHLFKKITGMTLLQYVTERRISEAKKLLLLSSKPISEIAMMTGFSSFSFFSRTFSKLTGCTPLEFRKK